MEESFVKISKISIGNSSESSPLDPIINYLNESLIKADFLKTMTDEMKEIFKKEKKNYLLEIINISESMDRVFKNIELSNIQLDAQTNAWIENFKKIKKMFDRVLKQNGVRPIQAPDNKAVPGFHTVTDTKKVVGMENNIIIDELVKGYVWDAEVFRKYYENKINEGRSRNLEWIDNYIKISGDEYVILRKSEVIVVLND